MVKSFFFLLKYLHTNFRKQSETDNLLLNEKKITEATTNTTYIRYKPEVKTNYGL